MASSEITLFARPWVIYVLKCPRTFEVRYVGKTKLGTGKRLMQHMAQARTGKVTRKNVGIRELLAASLEPLIAVIDSGEGMRWKEAERAWIAFYRTRGEAVWNVLDGGTGAPDITPERRAEAAKKSAVTWAANATPEKRASRAAKWRALMTPERMSAFALKSAASRSPEERSKTAANREQNRTAGSREIISNKAKARMTLMTPEAKAAKGRAAIMSVPPERRSEIARHARMSLTPQQRSEASRAAVQKMWEDRTPEQRAERERKRIATLQRGWNAEKSKARSESICAGKAKAKSARAAAIAARE